MAKVRLFIDLGCFKTLIFREDKGLVLNEPTKVLYEKKDGENTIVQFGNKAVKSIESTNQFVVNPIIAGLIVDEIACASMIRDFLRRVIDDKPNAEVEAFLSVPCGATGFDKKRYYSACYTAGIDVVYLVPTPLADLFGCGVTFADFEYCGLVDIGAGCTDIAILGQGEILKGVTLNVGSSGIDKSIINNIKSKYGVKISIENAVSLKDKIGSLIPNATKTLSVIGREAQTGERKIFNVTGFDILDSIKDYYLLIADSIKTILKSLDKNVLQSVMSRGIIFCGNGTIINGLQEFMTQLLNTNIYLTQDDVAIYGLQKISQNKKFIKNLS